MGGSLRPAADPGRASPSDRSMAGPERVYPPMSEVGGLDMMRSDALGALYLRSAGRAEALARALTGDPHLAQDIAQDAFIRVAGRFGHLRQPDAFESYLQKAVVNLCHSHFR